MKKIAFCLCTFSPDGNSRLNEVKTVIRRTSPHVDRTIVIDGGSTDGIIEWLSSEECKKLNVEVHVHPWMDDPPGQRNRYLRYADGDDWLIILDADELLEEPALYTLHQLAEESEKNGVTLVGFQSHDIIIDNINNGPVYENLAEHWAPSFFKHGPEVHYTGHTHVTLHALPGVRFNSHYRYFHIKTVADQWIRSSRNYWTSAKIAQNIRDDTWKHFRELCTSYGFKYFYELIASMRCNTIPENLIKFIIDNRDNDNPELRSLFVVYFVLLHPELNPGISNQDFKYDKDRKPVKAYF